VTTIISTSHGHHQVIIKNWLKLKKRAIQVIKVLSKVFYIYIATNTTCSFNIKHDRVYSQWHLQQYRLQFISCIVKLCAAELIFQESLQFTGKVKGLHSSALFTVWLDQSHGNGFFVLLVMFDTSVENGLCTVEMQVKKMRRVHVMYCYMGFWKRHWWKYKS
jgi:hypothetical protein